MRSAKTPPVNDEMHREYDFTGGIRGKYAARFEKGSNVTVLAPDVAEVFKTSKAVHKPWSLVAEIANLHRGAIAALIRTRRLR